MRNPLNKRFARELRTEIGKYIAIMVFMIATIGFISGGQVAGLSMVTTFNNNFEDYNIEDGHFELAQEASKELLDLLEEKDVDIYDSYYIEGSVYKNNESESESVLRVFMDRKTVNKVCLISGEMPTTDKEIAIDRMYATNNKIEIGDTIKLGNEEYVVSGYIALPDYSTLFSDNADTMFDAMKFGVAIMSDEGFENINNTHMHYSYSWTYRNKPESDKEKKEYSDDFLSVLSSNVMIENYVPEYMNQAIHFAGDDLGKDKVMFVVLLYIVIVIMAFIFGVTTNNTIIREANVIGTLRASGYTKGEIIRHYMTTPLLVTIISAVIGNVLGYTVFKDMVAGMYYGSYSLTTYHTIWSSEAFMLTTVIPFIIIFIINLFMIWRKMSLSPLAFIRRDLSKNKKKKTMILPRFKFFHRFRMRIIFQNIPSYIVLLVGICMANALLLFGLMMNPLLAHFQDEILSHQIANYQYILKTPIVTDEKDAEKYSVYSLKTTFEGFDEEDITIFGVVDESKYINQKIKKGEIYISDGFAAKYNLEIGDTFTLNDSYKDTDYTYKITGTYDYPAILCVFMNIEQFNEELGYDKEYFSGYFSDVEITDIDDVYIKTTITQDDLTKTSRQIEKSMGGVFYLFHGFAVALYLLVIYLLAKVVLEKNTTSISMVKILGYDNREVKRLYLSATGIAVAIIIIITIPMSRAILYAIYRPMMQQAFTGWLPYYIEPYVYPEMFLIGMVTYFVVELILYRKIKKIPMDEALKNVE